MKESQPLQVLFLEPFDGGSHRAVWQTWARVEPARVAWHAQTLPARHWKWRMRGSAAWFADRAAELPVRPDLVLATSFLPLAEWRGLVPQWADVPAVLYFHENQLAYPDRGNASARERDLHFAFTQWTSALAANECWFNSRYNLESFLEGARALLARMPDATLPGWLESVRAKSRIIPCPVDVPAATLAQCNTEQPLVDHSRGPLVVWNHRWEHDKDPDTFFTVLGRLADRAVPFRLALCGARFEKVPEVFERARARFADRIVQFGPLARREDYLALLGRSDLAVSTARQEFFGMAVLEAALLGARVLVPDRLAYQETVPAEFRYTDVGDLETTLERLCRGFAQGELRLRTTRPVWAKEFLAERQLPQFATELHRVARSRAGGPSLQDRESGSSPISRSR